MFNFVFKKVQDKADYSYTARADFSKLNQGIGPFLALYIIFKLLEKREISLDDRIEINETAIKERGRGIVGYQLGDHLSLLQVLTYYKVTSGVDSLFLLANHVYIKTKKRMSDYFNELIVEYKLSPNCAKNLSGKTNSKFKQDYRLEDILLIAELLSQVNPFYLNILNQSKTTYRGQNYFSQTFLLDLSKITYFFSFLNITVTWQRENCKNFSYIVTQGIEHVFQQDSIIERILLNQEISQLASKYIQVHKCLNKTEVFINLIGDTYLGEYYMERRRKRKVFFDPLLHHGYDYSFEKLKSFLHNADMNIVNHEACFIDASIQSPLKGLKKFILGANDQKTVEALKKANIYFLSLANNHTADYGVQGISHTLEVLNDANIRNFGAGMNEQDACKPLRIQVNNKIISFYSGYWHRATNQKIFKFYATPSEPGVATLESMLTESIQAEKKYYPEHIIIVLTHWGVDFLPTHPYQQKIAKILLHSGADLIVGHGAHTLQSIEEYDGKTILYSIGNGIFNSDGEYDGYPDALPFGMIAQLHFNHDSLNLRLFPIDTNNRKTMWQPNFVNLEEFSVVESFYAKNQFEYINKDNWPYYFEKKLDKKLTCR